MNNYIKAYTNQMYSKGLYFITEEGILKKEKLLSEREKTRKQTKH